MTGVALLRKIMDDKRKTVAEVSEAAGMDDSTFYRKLNREGATFTVEQAFKISKFLSLTPDQATDIFFCRETCGYASNN